MATGLRSRDLLLASIAGFISWGLLVGWFPFLRFLGWAFVAGACTTVFGILLLVFAAASPRDRFDHGGVIGFGAGDGKEGAPTLAFTRPDRWMRETRRYMALMDYRAEPLYPQSFVVSEALDDILGYVLRDFVKSWYTHISPSPVFVNEIDRAIRIALLNIRDRLMNEDLVEVAVSRLVPVITAHLRDFDAAERAIRGKTLDKYMTESDELDLALARKYRDGKLHEAVPLTFSDPKQVQQEYLRKLVVRILPIVLPEGFLKSRAVVVLVKEIVACAVLYPVVQMLSDPDTWNQLIEAIGRTALQDRKTVKQLRAALDEHASPGQQVPKLMHNDPERAFERWVRAIRRCNNLSDARRFRSHIVSQLKRESMVEDQDQVFIRRLETGKRVLDQKISKLSLARGEQKSVSFQPDAAEQASVNHDINLVDLLHNASGLSYFMEFMDRQHMLPMVQFWIVVDGFRDPLEDDFGEDASSATRQWTPTDRADVAQIHEAYISKPELNVPRTSQQAVKTFLEAGKKATSQQYRLARTAILMAQSAVLEEMQHRYYPKFKKTDLYYKFLSSDESKSLQPASAAPQRPPMPDRTVTAKPVVAAVLKPRPQAPALLRSKTQPSARPADLRRAAVSATDIRSITKLNDETSSQRGSFDSDRSAPLFDDEYDTDPLANSSWSIGRDSANGDDDAANDNQVIESMEAALNEIVTSKPNNEPLDFQDSLFSESPVSTKLPEFNRRSPSVSSDLTRVEIPSDRAKPSIASLGLVNTSSRIGVFTDDDLFPDERKFIEDEYPDQDTAEEKEVTDEEIHEAAPGDLGLVEAIAALTADINRLVAQESVVDTLTRKAELTNNAAELRILSKSKSSLQREIRRKELQKQQYVVQESDNSLYGRSTVRIKSIMVGKEEDGREYALYLIEVQRQAGEHMAAASWAVARRYSEFHDLHQKLRARYPSVRHLEFPRRRMVMKLQKEFLHKRRLALESYLRELLLMPNVCRSRDLRSFLSQQAIVPSSAVDDDANTKDIVSRIYNSVTDGMDDFLGNIAVLDQLSAAGQNLISAATTQLGTFNGAGPPDASVAAAAGAAVGVSSDDPTTIAEAEAELAAYESNNRSELEPFVKPICDIFLETFELNKGNNWLRGRAVVVVLHQLLGGTIERKVRDAVRSFTQDDSILKNINMIKDMMWPGGGKMRASVVRTPAEKSRSKTEASLMLATLIPDLAGSVVGRANAQAAARRIAATVANQRLNAHVAFTLIDEVVSVIFGSQPGLAPIGKKSRS